MEPAPDGAGLTSLDMLIFLDAPVNSTEEQCFSARSRSTVLEGLPFGGVPTVLAINFTLWLVRARRVPFLRALQPPRALTATRKCSPCTGAPG